MFFFQKDYSAGITRAIVAHGYSLATKLPDTLDKTEGVRLTEVVNGDREPRSDQRHTKAEEEHPPGGGSYISKKHGLRWSLQVHKEWLLMREEIESERAELRPICCHACTRLVVAMRNVFEQVYLDAWLRAEQNNEALHLLKSALQPVVTFALPPLLPTANPALLVSVAPVQEYAPKPVINCRAN